MGVLMRESVLVVRIDRPCWMVVETLVPDGTWEL